MASELRIPIVGFDMVPRETTEGHSTSMLVLDLQERTVAIVQEVPRVAIELHATDQYLVRFGVPRIDAEMMSLFLQHQAQELLTQICDGCTVDIEDGQVVYEMNDDAGEACMELEDLVNTLTY